MGRYPQSKIMTCPLVHVPGLECPVTVDKPAVVPPVMIGALTVLVGVGVCVGVAVTVGVAVGVGVFVDVGVGVLVGV